MNKINVHTGMVDPKESFNIATASLLDRFSLITLWGGGLLFLFTLFRGFIQGWNASIILDMLFYMTTVVLLQLKRKLGIHLVCGFLTVLVGGFAIAHYILYGLVLGDFLKLTVCCLVVGATFSLRTGLFTLILSICLAIAVALGAHYGVFPLLIFPPDYMVSSWTWIAHILISAVLTAVMLVIVTSMYPRIFATLNDLSRQAKKLIESEKKFRLIAENMREVVFIQDMELQLKYISPSAEPFFGYPLEEITKRWMKALLVSGDTKKADTFFRKYDSTEFKKNIIIPKLDLDFIRKDGTTLTGEIQPFFLTDKKNNLIGIQAVIRDVSEKKETERKKRKAVKKKEFLINELFQRTEKNIELINYMVLLQVPVYAGTPTAGFLKDVQIRFRAMSMVHQKLSQNNERSKVALKEYLGELAEFLMKAYSAPEKTIKLRLNLDSITVSLENATPYGLLLNELLVNVFKHAFKGRQTGSIDVQLIKTKNGGLELSVIDDGIGLPKEININSAKTFGFNILRTLGEKQLGGELSIDSSPDKGCSFKLILNQGGLSGRAN
ncbi:MAG: PAS domain S-box protein [Fibrobacteria bacterium]|nr:PAS domain S-box protein [Fibrobacteria bacterium]